jgi:hypothetical protein
MLRSRLDIVHRDIMVVNILMALKLLLPTCHMAMISSILSHQVMEVTYIVCFVGVALYGHSLVNVECIGL